MSTPVNPDVEPDVTNSSAGGESATRAGDGFLHDGETVRGRGRCWAALRRDRVPLLVLARRSYELVLTDRRVLLVPRTKHQRKRLGLGPDGVALEHDLALLRLQRRRDGIPLLQLLVLLPTERTLVLEFDPARRPLGRDVAGSLTPA